MKMNTKERKKQLRRLRLFAKRYFAQGKSVEETLANFSYISGFSLREVENLFEVLKMAGRIEVPESEQYRGITSIPR